MTIKWKVLNIDLRDVGTGDSVEVTHANFLVYDSAYISPDFSLRAERRIPWVPKEELYYADSASARAITQDSAITGWLENVDSDHVGFMERLEWKLREEIWFRAHELTQMDIGDSYKGTKVVFLDDSAEVSDPLGS